MEIEKSEKRQERREEKDYKEEDMNTDGKEENVQCPKSNKIMCVVLQRRRRIGTLA